MREMHRLVTFTDDVVMREADVTNEDGTDEETAVFHHQLQTAPKVSSLRRSIHKLNGSSPVHATPSTIATAFEGGAEDSTSSGALTNKSVKFPSFPFRNDVRALESSRVQQSSYSTPPGYSSPPTESVDCIHTYNHTVTTTTNLPPSGLILQSPCSIGTPDDRGGSRAKQQLMTPLPPHSNDSDVEDDARMQDNNTTTSSVDDEVYNLPTCDIEFDSPPTPNAPRRTKSMNWLRFMLDNADEDLQGALATDDTIDINSDVYIEWIEWNKDGTLASSDVVWTPPIALACRWNSPKILKTLIDAGVDLQVSNHLQQNLLVILCAQPKLSQEMLITLREVYKPEMYNISRYQLLGKSSSSSSSSSAETNILLDQFIELRSQEMVLMAQLLLLNGISPHQNDIYGKCAADYCSEFGHTLILRLFEVAVAQPMIYMGVSRSSSKKKGVSNNSPLLPLDRCHTPPRKAKASVKVSTPRRPIRCSTPERSAIRTPCPPDDFSTPIIGSVTCPSSLPTGCPSTSMNVKRRGRRLSSALGPPKHVADEINEYSSPQMIGI